MKSNDQLLLEEAYVNICLVNENQKQAKVLVDQGKLSIEDFNEIMTVDPTPTKKYVGWLSKQKVSGNLNDIEGAKDLISTFHKLATAKKIKQLDIVQYKTVQDLKAAIESADKIGATTSKSQLQGSFDVIRDDENLLIISPYTHEASIKLGRTLFAYRADEENGTDSAWCITRADGNWWSEYYNQDKSTFYFVKVKSPQLLTKLEENGFGMEYSVVAIEVPGPAIAGFEAKELTGWDAEDEDFGEETLDQYLTIIGLSKQILVPKRLKGRVEHGSKVANKVIQQYIDRGSKGVLDLEGLSISALPPGLVVDGDLVLTKSSIEALPPDLKVTGDMYVGFSPLYHLAFKKVKQVAGKVYS